MQYTRESLEEEAKRSAYWKQAQKIHRERCESDLMYALFFAPETKTADDGVLLIDQVLQSFFAIVAKKHAPAYNKNRRIACASRFLKAEKADTLIKLFNVLLMLNRETELQDLVRNAYDRERNLWGAACNEHFDNFLRHLYQMVEATLNWPYNERNIVLVVRNFVYGAQSHYMNS